MIGHAASLNSDLGRAHHLVVFGGEQPDLDWGPGVQGLAHEAWIAHSRKTKGTKVVVVGPRKTPFAAEMNQYLAIRPGTEPFFLLGMLSAAVAGDWRDQQFVDDYTTGWAQLVELVAPWPVERCARICGVEAATLSGVALKFCRSAMSVAHPDYSTFANAQAGVGAWAWLALHTITANTLRPGALYEHIAPIDLHLKLSQLRLGGAPRTRATDQPLLLLQAPADTLADEILVPGEGQVRGLVCVAGDPVRRLAGTARVEEASTPSTCWSAPPRARTRPPPAPTGCCPCPTPGAGRCAAPRRAPAPAPPASGHAALVEPAGSAAGSPTSPRTSTRRHPGLRKTAYGAHVALAARALAGSDLATWERRVVDCR